MAVHGPITGCDLEDVSALFTEWEERNGLLQPRLSPAAARLSLELATTAYNLETDIWRDAGWRDLSYQVDNTLLSGAAVNGRGSHGLSGAISEYFQRLAQSRLKRQNPISQIRGVLRQREGSDTCKAIVMLHPAAGGRYIVAIGFMGTGKRIYDWFSNFRVSAEDGMHLGFLQLTKQFEGNHDKIYFPETARELGLEQLTLADILEELKRPDSRFRLWMAGHSQGGAIMQLMAYRAAKRGVLRQNLLGYGFASPTVLYDHPPFDPGGFPLFHFINADDVTPRVGAALHVGRCEVYTPDDAMRQLCYQRAWREPAFLPTLQLLHTIRDSSSAFLTILGFLHALQEQPEEDAVSLFASLLSRFLPYKWVSSLGGRMDSLLRPLIHGTEKGYFQASGKTRVPKALLQPLTARFSQLMAQYGAPACTKAVASALALPHKIRLGEGETASYQYIVNRGQEKLRQRVWMGASITSEGLPRRPMRILPGGPFARLSQSRNRRAAKIVHKEEP